MTTTPNPEALQPATMVDSDHPSVIAFAREHAQGADERERAVALHYAVRDGFRYDPYRIDMSVRGLKASTVLANGYGWCVPKAALLAAACRAAGIAARVGYADVRKITAISLTRTCCRSSSTAPPTRSTTPSIAPATATWNT